MKQRGITLIELVLVIAVIGILVGLFMVYRNPSTQAAINRNLEREFDITQIAQSLHQYKVHHKDQYPKTNQDEKIVDCKDEEEEPVEANEFSQALVSDYLTKIPKDPQTESQYLVCLTEEGKIKVMAEDAELGKEIELIR